MSRFKGARLGSGTRPRREGPLSDKHRFVGQRYTLLPSGDGKCVETTQGTNDGSNPSARGASRAAILQRFSLDNKSFDRPGTVSMRHTSKASEGILSSLREMNDSTSCYHAMTAVCHGCTAIDEVLLSWTYIHHSSDSLHEVIHSLTSFRHGRKSFTIRIKLRFADYLRNDQSERPDKGRSLRYRAVGVGMQPASCSTAG